MSWGICHLTLLENFSHRNSLVTLLLLNRRNRMSGYPVNTAANSMGLMWNPLRHNNCKNYRINEVLFASWGSQRATRLWIPALSSYTTTTWLISIFRGQPGPSSTVITSSNPIFSLLLMEIFFEFVYFWAVHREWQIKFVSIPV